LELSRGNLGDLVFFAVLQLRYQILH